MKLTLSLDEAQSLVPADRRKPLASVNRLVREFLEQLGAKPDPAADAAEFRRLSLEAKGRSRGWKFNRDEVHQR